MKIREAISTHKIALLATGDEISNGDILNSNTREIARRLNDLGMHIGMHATTPDNIADIEKTIHFLLKSHQALIITGGLGPTSDDLTRFALGNATHRPLIFDEATWDIIVNRLKLFGYHTPPESNRQQALFPEGAEIIPNPNGTAAGCSLEHNNQFIFMLPGPPSECLPMLDSAVIPTLKKQQFQQVSYHKSWMLFGVSEGQIAEELDAIAKPFNCITGYRITHPYIEFKIFSNDENDFKQIAKLMDEKLSPYLISQGTQTASGELIDKLTSHKEKIYICDHATGGFLESLLLTPATYQSLSFVKQPFTENPHFIISGLNEFWHQTDTTETSIELEYDFKNKKDTITKTMANRGERVKRYTAEWICYQINQLLK